MSGVGFALNGAANVNWFVVRMIPLTGGQLSKIRCFASSVTGTLGASDCVCDVYNDTAGVLGTLIETRTTVTTTPTGAAVIEWTGFTATLTAGTPYYFVFRNAAASPTVNSYTMYYVTGFGSAQYYYTSTAPTAGVFHCFTSTNSGTTLTSVSGMPGMVLEYSGGAKEGFPMNATMTATTNQAAYASREFGNMFITPNYAPMRVVGILAAAGKTGTPTGSLRARVYSGSGASPTLLATTATTLVAAQVNTSLAGKCLYFSTPLVLPMNTAIRVVISETAQADASGNRYGLNAFSFNSSDSTLVYPWSSTAVKTTLSTDGGATFSETSDAAASIYLIPDADQPFDISAIRFNPGMVGGTNG